MLSSRGRPLRCRCISFEAAAQRAPAPSQSSAHHRVVITRSPARSVCARWLLWRPRDLLLPFHSTDLPARILDVKHMNVAANYSIMWYSSTCCFGVPCPSRARPRRHASRAFSMPASKPQASLRVAATNQHAKAGRGQILLSAGPQLVSAAKSALTQNASATLAESALTKKSGGAAELSKND
jgi:hypothetical protein